MYSFFNNSSLLPALMILPASPVSPKTNRHMLHHTQISLCRGSSREMRAAVPLEPGRPGFPGIPKRKMEDDFDC